MIWHDICGDLVDYIAYGYDGENEIVDGVGPNHITYKLVRMLGINLKSDINMQKIIVWIETVHFLSDFHWNQLSTLFILSDQKIGTWGTKIT